MGVLGRHIALFGRAAVMVAASVVAVTVGAGPEHTAHALEGEGFRFDAAEEGSVEYEHTRPMAGTAEPTVTDPATCVAAVWCTVVPVEILPPVGRSVDDDWIVNIELHWRAGQVQTGLAGTVDGNDLDLYVWHEEAVPDASGSRRMQYVESGRSTSTIPGAGVVPEVVKLFRPERGQYWLVAANVVGVNNGFTVKMSSLVVPIGSVDPAPGALAPPEKPSALLPRGAAAPAAAASGVIGPPESRGPLAEPVPDIADDDFGFGGRATFEDELAGPIRGSLYEERVLGPPRPVSAATIALWMGLVPLLVLGGSAAIFLKRRPSALTFHLPRRG